MIYCSFEQKDFDELDFGRHDGKLIHVVAVAEDLTSTDAHRSDGFPVPEFRAVRERAGGPWTITRYDDGGPTYVEIPTDGSEPER